MDGISIEGHTFLLLFISYLILSVYRFSDPGRFEGQQYQIRRTGQLSLQLQGPANRITYALMLNGS